MKQKLEDLMGSIHEARVVHDRGEDTLEEHEHHDPAIVCMWELLGALTKLVIDMAEVQHAHVDYHHDMHGHNPKAMSPAQPRQAL